MKERDSNIELFRIVATLMILVLRCNGWFLREWGGVTSWLAGQGMLVGSTRALIQSLTCIGVDCFVLISGFFSIKPKLKSIVNLFSIPLFIYLVCYGLAVFSGDKAFAWSSLMNQFFAFSAGGNWFIQSYLVLMLLSPALNAFIEKCSERQLAIYTVIYLAFMFYFSVVWGAEKFLFNKGYSFGTFVGLYLVGRYINLYGLERVKKYPQWLGWLLFGVSIVLMTIFRFVSTNEEKWLTYDSPLLIIPSALLLICFAQLHFKSKLVNWLAPSCLAAFILHTCDPVINWFAGKDVEWFTTLPFGQYLLYMSGLILLVYMTAVLLDNVRRIMMKPILDRIGKLKI